MYKTKTEIAEKYLRGLYKGELFLIDKLIADDIVLSYPIFKKLYGTSAIRGRNSVKKFSSNFNSRWSEQKLTIHESVEESNKVVLVWSFQGRFVKGEKENHDLSIRSWGGITLVKFDNFNKIIAEIGEESDPGPFARYTQK